jgi:hypothetical protein
MSIFVITPKILPFSTTMGTLSAFKISWTRRREEWSATVSTFRTTKGSIGLLRLALPTPLQKDMVLHFDGRYMEEEF